MIITLRTDKPEAEIGLFDAKGAEVETIRWRAHMQLAETLHEKLLEILNRHQLGLDDVTGIVVFTGPGSYTGLRIGITVANALSSSLNIPISGANGNQWVHEGLQSLKLAAKTIITPTYGGDLYVSKLTKN